MHMPSKYQIEIHSSNKKTNQNTPNRFHLHYRIYFPLWLMSFLSQRDMDQHLLPGVNNSDFWGDFIQTSGPRVDRVPLSNAFR